MKKLGLITILIILTAGLLIACTATIEFKIDFIVDDSVYATINTNGSETISMPSDPTKDGFFFDGWYWDNNSWQKPFTGNSLLNEPLSENLRVYAKWNAEDALEGTQATFEGFTKINESIYSITVSNATQLLNFSDIVEINNKSTWKLTTDIQGNNTIASRIATLTAGDNKYYVLVTAENTAVKLYTLNIRRKPLYLVTFNTTDGTSIDSQNIEEDNFATLPAQPTRTGFSFVNWNFDFSNAITKTTTITASWQANTYKITYHANNGTEDTEEQNAVFNSSVDLLGNTAFTKTAYDLVRWNTKADGTGINYSCNFNIADYNTADNLALYAVWLPTTYTITYHLDSGINGNNPLNYNVESATIILIDADKTGYSFNGWYSESGFINKIEQVESGSYGNIDLYTKFTVIPYNISYHLDNGINDNNPVTYTIETNTIILENASKTGYTFGGWFTEDTYENKITTIPKGNIGNKNLYAKFTIINYEITYNLDNGTNGDNPSSYTIECNPIILLNADKFGFRFDGWFTENTFENEIEHIISGSYGNIELFAKFTKIAFEIVYYSNYGTDNQVKQNVIYDANATLYDDTLYSRSGYNLIGWNTKKDGNGTDYILSYQFTPYAFYDDLELYAVWEVVRYDITYFFDNGINGENPLTYTVEDSIMLDNASKTGYTFNGWYNESTFENKITEIEKGNTGNKILYAKFTAINYTITYHLYDGINNVDNPLSYTIENNTITLFNANKTGYIFDGWFMENTFENEVKIIDQGSYGNIDFFTKFTPITYDIVYHLANGTNGDNPENYTIETDTITLQDASKTGYTFEDWYLECSFENKITVIEKGSIENIELYAKFTLITYTITYHLNSGTNGSNPSNYTIESATIALKNPTKTSYVFTGWFLESNFENNVTEIETGSYDNISLYARWAATVAFDSNGGTSVNSITQDYGTLIIAPSNPIRTNYRFITWQLNGVDYVFATMPSENITLKAIWQPFEGGIGTENNPYIISSVYYLNLFATWVNSGNKYTDTYFALGQNIDLGNAEWTPIGKNSTYYFNGYFNGNGFTICNFKITSQTYAGLFGYNYGTLKNLGVEKFTINTSFEYSQTAYAGGLIGYNLGVITNCYATGNVTMTVSYSTDTSSIIKSYSYAGGLVGYSSGIIANCYTTGNVTAKCSQSYSYYATDSYSYAGGLVGSNSGSISNCYTWGNVTSTAYSRAYAKASSSASSNAHAYAGGLIGRSNAGIITNCYSSGNIIADSSASGQSAGTTSCSSYSYAGGLIGQNYSQIISSFSFGNVTATSYTDYYATANYAYVGNLVGNDSDLDTCYRYEEQMIMGKNINNLGNICTLIQLNDIDFYFDILGWNNEIWDFSDLDFETGIMPTLKI